MSLKYVILPPTAFCWDAGAVRIDSPFPVTFPCYEARSPDRGLLSLPRQSKCWHAVRTSNTTAGQTGLEATPFHLFRHGAVKCDEGANPLA
jgi:hypothetical protein